MSIPNRFRWLMMLVVLAFSLSCFSSPRTIPDRPTVAPIQSFLSEVTAEVFTGGNVHVQIQYVRGKETQAILTCDYPDGKGGTSQYQYMDLDVKKPGTVTSFDLTLKTNGTYTVTCRMGSNEKSASFTINEPTVSVQSDLDSGAIPGEAFTITGTGMWTENFHNPDGTCSVRSEQVELRVHEDSTAELVVFHPVWTTFGPPCTTSRDMSGYNFGSGKVDRVKETVTYTSCIDVPGQGGLYSAEGQLSYSGGVLQGEITCFDTGAGLSTSTKIVMP